MDNNDSSDEGIILSDEKFPISIDKIPFWETLRAIFVAHLHVAFASASKFCFKTAIFLPMIALFMLSCIPSTYACNDYQFEKGHKNFDLKANTDPIMMIIALILAVPIAIAKIKPKTMLLCSILMYSGIQQSRADEMSFFATEFYFGT